MIRHTHARSPARHPVRLSGQCRGHRGHRAATRYFADPRTGIYGGVAASRSTSCMKVETHNHPTAISPFPGAATGSGGEIRDEGATGRGAKPKAGLTGFSVSNLRIPGFERPWERPVRQTGAHRFGARDHARRADRRRLVQQRIRPPGNLRLFPHIRAAGSRGCAAQVRGYHKPIMIAGGLGNIRREHVEKGEVPAGRTARGARRSGHADRPGRRRGLVARQRRIAARTWISPPCSAATRRSSGARRK